MSVHGDSIYPSKGELEVLRLSAEGYTSKEIGCKLQITENSVVTYRKRFKEKLSCKNCSELIYRAAKSRFI